MSTNKTPGVSIEETIKLPPSIASVATAIPAFIGYTQITNRTGDIITPVRIDSLIAYEAAFGTADPAPLTVTIKDTLAADGVTITERLATASPDLQPANTMYYQMQMYFANGGGPCYIVSVGKSTLTISPSYLADITLGLDKIKTYDEPTLLVFPDGGVAAYTDLGVIYNNALAQCAQLGDRFVIMDCPANNVLRLRQNTGTENLKYGAAYHSYLMTTVNFLYDDTTVTIAHTQNGVPVVYGINNKLSEVPGSNSTEKSIIDNLVRQTIAGLGMTLNPSPAIAGLYAATDRTRGVWKSPGNTSLNLVTRPTRLGPANRDTSDRFSIDETDGKSVNVIVPFSYRGTVVLGARTLAGNDNEWRYIATRRFFCMVEKSIKKATAAFVFENNDANTWTRIQSMIYNYLLDLWRQGALQGAKPEQAFYVAVGLNKTMTSQDILEGRMIVEIGLAALRPAEFIILRFSHMMATS